MFQFIYIEDSVANHPFTSSICKRFPDIPRIPCTKYGEVFNRKAQNFRLQKANPSLILAKKFTNFVLSTPPGYGIEGARNYYFSHMLNCIYDCRYCFLQGMYRSANYVLFVNFEDFQSAIEATIRQAPAEPAYFFSGYDCDSLALESITHFVEEFLPLFAKYPRALLELRTKSTNIQFLLDTPPLDNCVIAFSLTPTEISRALEHRTPSISKRLSAVRKLQAHGWPVALHFDPLIYCSGYQDHYEELFAETFREVDPCRLKYASLGAFRLPKGIYKQLSRLYPDEKLFAHSLDDRRDVVSYQKELEKEIIDFCTHSLLKYVPENIFYPCKAETL